MMWLENWRPTSYFIIPLPPQALQINTRDACIGFVAVYMHATSVFQDPARKVIIMLLSSDKILENRCTQAL
jgi:hypothetical protein